MSNGAFRRRFNAGRAVNAGLCASLASAMLLLATGGGLSAPRTQNFAGPNQSEGITFTADGRSWLTTAEGSSAIYRADQTCP